MAIESGDREDEGGWKGGEGERGEREREKSNRKSTSKYLRARTIEPSPRKKLIAPDIIMIV